MTRKAVKIVMKNKPRMRQQPKMKRVVQVVQSRPRQRPQPRNNNSGSKRVTRLGQLFRQGGGVVGGMLGSSSLGRMAGAGISRILGQGDYKIQSNSLISGGPPSFAALDAGVRLSHREFVADVKSSTTFNVTTYQLTPFNSALFPWLNTMSDMFDEFQFNGLVIYFNTTCGSAISSTNNALGTIGMVTIYDPSDPDLSTKRECEDASGCVAGVPSCSLMHPVECKPRANVLSRLYIPQENSLANVEDIKFYSLGKLNVFTQGMQQAGVTIGELWVSYDITFYKPRISASVNSTGISGRASWTATGFTTSLPLGNISQSATNGTLNWTYSGSSGNITLPQGTPAGNYLMLVYFNGATALANNLSVTAATLNVTNLTTFGGNSYYEIIPSSSPVAGAHAIAYTFTKSDENLGTAALGWGSSPSGFGSSAAVDVIITTIDANISNTIIPIVSRLPDFEQLMAKPGFARAIEQFIRQQIKPDIEQIPEESLDELE